MSDYIKQVAKLKTQAAEREDFIEQLRTHEEYARAEIDKLNEQVANLEEALDASRLAVMEWRARFEEAAKAAPDKIPENTKQ